MMIDKGQRNKCKTLILLYLNLSAGGEQQGLHKTLGQGWYHMSFMSSNTSGNIASTIIGLSDRIEQEKTRSLGRDSHIKAEAL